ncbi:unnamed protein product [Pleuronectes platessa]|uniref:RecA family profile 1 domain-containing protein n=1 Tax=Pleuronectes platessa TaxID=8262 RepID=A0A9N7UIC6_PLEPL|nr:unnamed protein product [Pleuronectes platessa]
MEVWSRSRVLFAGSDEEALCLFLSRLLVVHCSSSSQLLLPLHFLENSFSRLPGLALLLIDNISAFYWLDRCEGGASFAKQEDKLSKCSELLGRLLRDYRITVLATCHALRRSHRGTSSDSHRPYLCRPWQRLVTHRLLCRRQEAPNNGSAAAGSSEEQGRRQVFTVHCTSRGTRAPRSSSFYVTDGGVEFT